MNRVAIYCRLSVEDGDKREDEDSESINNQKLLLVEYAIAHDLDIYRIYVDDNYSGLSDNRPAFKQLIEDAKKKKFNVIICKTQSRFTRDMIMVEQYIHGLLPELGIRFIGILDNTDSEDKGNKRARQIYGLVNEWYCEELSDNIRLVLNKKRYDGEFIGSSAPFGYRKSEKDKHLLIINQEEAKIVKEIYQLYLNGYSIRGICEELTKRKVPTPSQYRYEACDRKEDRLDKKNKLSSTNSNSTEIWAASTVKKILHAEVYLGHMVQGKERKVSYKSHRRVYTNEAEWFVKYNTHEPIITYDIFEKVQNKLYKRRNTKQNGRYSRKDPLVGKVICGHCKRVMYKTSGNKTNQKYFHCSTYVMSKGEECVKNSIRSDQIETLLQEEFYERIREVIQVNRLSFSKLFHQVMKGTEKESSNKDTLRHKLKEVDDSIQDYHESMISVYLDKTKGAIKDEIYSNLITNINQKIELLQLEKMELTERLMNSSDFLFLLEKLQGYLLTNNDNLTPDTSISYEQVLKKLVMNLLSEDDNKKIFMDDLIENIEISELDKNNQNVRIHWKI